MRTRLLQNLQADAQPARRWISSLWLAVVVGCVYALSAKMSLALLTPEGVAEFWPAAGGATGTLIALGRNARWGVTAGTMVATIVANLMGDRNLLSSVVFAVCNAGEALLAAGLIERYFGWPFSLDRLRHVLALLGAAIVATAVSGIGGTLGFVLFHDSAAPFLVTWQNWFASDALGVVTVAPLVIGLTSVAREPPARGETIEGFLGLALLIVMSIIVIKLPQQPWTTIVPIALLFPILLWIAARCQPVFAAAAAFIVTLAIVIATTIGIGHFGDPGLPVAERVLAARAGILAVALCAYVLAALFAERRQHEAALADSERRRRSRRGRSQRSYGTPSRVRRSAAPTQRRSWVSTRSKPLARTTFSRECILMIESGSRPPCAASSPNTLHIPSPSASSTPTAGKSGSRKRQRANLIPRGA